MLQQRPVSDLLRLRYRYSVEEFMSMALLNRMYLILFMQPAGGGPEHVCGRCRLI